MTIRVPRLIRSAGLLLSISVAWLPAAAAADYPEKPIRLIVPQAPGSATDVLARLLASELGPALGGATIVVDNRPGGALTLGLDLTAKSPPDGYTLCMGPIGALAITRHMVAKLPYDIERDFQPIALVSRGHLLRATAPMLPVKTVQELIDYAKQRPGKLTNASSSNGSPGHVGGELFKYMTGTEIVHVPYKGFEALHITPLRSIGLAQAIEYARNWSILLRGSPPGSTPIAGTLAGHQGRPWLAGPVLLALKPALRA